MHPRQRTNLQAQIRTKLSFRFDTNECTISVSFKQRCEHERTYLHTLSARSNELSVCSEIVQAHVLLRAHACLDFRGQPDATTIFVKVRLPVESDFEFLAKPRTTDSQGGRGSAPNLPAGIPMGRSAVARDQKGLICAVAVKKILEG